MTEERKQYLKSISKEERTIRELIEKRKRTIKYYKSLMNEDKEDTVYINDVGKPQIAIRKFLIKALKKQLPAPRKHYTDEVCDYIGCPICYFEIYKDYPCYCLECGQKLR